MLKPDEVKIQEFLSKSNDELFEILGISLSGSTLEAFPSKETIKQAKIIGSSWYKKNSDKLRATICGSEFVKQYQESDLLKNRIETITVIADLICGYTTGTSGFVVAVLIIREGIHSFCKDYKF